MPTRKQVANLKRGGIRGTPASAARAREGKTAHAAEDRRLGELAASDPYAAYDELHASMTRHVVKLLRAEERSGKPPSRDVTDRLREYRQLTESLAEYRRSQGASAEAEEFFATLGDRLAQANFGVCSKCGAQVGQPYLDEPEKKPQDGLPN